MSTARRHLTARTAAAAAVMALTLGGCGALGGDDDSGSDGDGTSSSSEESGEDGDSDGDSGEESGEGSGSEELDGAAEEAGVDPTKPPKPIASVTMPANSEADEPTDMTVDLISLKRQGDLMVLTVGVTPDKASKAKPSTFFKWTQSVFSPQVIDTKNLKVHNVAKADSLQVATGSSTVEFGPDQTMYMYAAFAAPPEDVDTVTVKAVEGAPPFTGVKVQ